MGKQTDDMAKEKARSLTQWFFDQTDHMQWEEAKECSCKVCDEIIDAGAVKYCANSSTLDFWIMVKNEINDNL